jgi:manganese efflux pump family protein
MSPVALVLLALAMSTDAFAAAVGKGAALHKPRLREALRTGVVFGSIEALTPVVGWALGRAAAGYIAAWDHWVAFVLLGVLGLRMVRHGLAAPEPDVPKPDSHSLRLLMLTGLATSIDALAVGVGLAFLDVNILVAAAAIGMSTLVLATLGVLLGRVLGALAGQRAEVAGGLVLIGVGAAILVEHLGAG